MSSAVAELDGYLQSMLSLRPPGVSGSKINSITSLCTANVQSESVLVQKIYTHFKRAPGTHKLGVLYVVDSVTRQWVESARKAGQSIGGTAPDGTFAAGVTRVTELLPVLMTDIIKNAPEDQKEKIKKLVDIWERGYTFPSNMLATFKEKLNAPASNNIESTTPEGSPAPNYIPLGQGQGQNGQTQPPQAPSAQPQAAPDTSSILKALADMAKQNTSSAPAGSGVPAHTSSNNVLNTQNAVSQPMPSSVDQATAVSGGQAVNPYAGNLATHLAGLNVPQNMGAGQTQSQTPPNPLAAAQSNPLAALLSQQQQQQQQPQQQQQHHQQPQQSQQAPGIGPEALQQVQLLQLLAAQGVPQDQWATALQILSLSNNPNTGMPNMNAGAVPGFPQGTPPAAPAAAAAAGSNAWGGRDVPSRDRDRDADYMRSPQGQYRRRSRSPGWDRRRNESPPRRRDSPVYGEYNADSPGRNRGDPREARGRRGGGHEYRQRSPPGRRRRSPSPPRKETSLPPAGPKVIEWDYTIGPGNIKVLSRTLFVGGVTTSEAYLRSIFAKFGTVQTCIVNIDKRHAFVKMINRRDAISAREGMEQYKTGEMQLRTRWGVGFGPRDCSDYQTGISIIPIERLTDADRKWMLSAEYGGTGGKPIEAGMVVEEPDIEIGAGVSSKAISRRMATDQGGKRGPQSTRTNPGPERFRRPDRGGMDGHDHHGQHDRAGSANPQNANANNSNSSNNNNNNNNNGIGVPPAVPGFGFSFPGMPLFPPGFMLGQQQQQGGSSSSTPAQPPPPGQGS